jgi:hypothetical protein
MVVVPFLSEDPELVSRTLDFAASHPRVESVIGVHGDDQESASEVKKRVSGISIVPQQRIGMRRPGKGDAINTGFAHFVASRCERLHFYDADIKTFNHGWIDQAEEGLDRGFDSARHFYSRAATDGMVTAMLVRPALAMSWPQSVLARIRQPLSGEVAFSREAALALAGQPEIRDQSDWGIDTIITGISARLGFSIYENYVPEGKDHQLYGSLGELETMFWECLLAVLVLRRGPAPDRVRHHVEFRESDSPSVVDRVAFDYAASKQLLLRPLARAELDVLWDHFPIEVARSIEGQTWDAFDSATWIDVVRVLITRADPQSEHWRALAFRLWVSRVLYYTVTVAQNGHRQAMAYIEAMIEDAILNPVN